MSDKAFVYLYEQTTFLRILFKWEGSIFKELGWDIMIYLLLYYIFAFGYAYGIVLNPSSRDIFSRIVNYVNVISSLLSISFLVGFFVSKVLGRWWKFTDTFPSLINTIVSIQNNVRTQNAEHKIIAKQLKFSLCRYIILAWIFHIRPHSYKLKTRFNIYPEGGSHLCDTCLCGNCLRAPKKITIHEYVKSLNNDPVIKQYLQKLVTSEETKLLENAEIEFGWNQGAESWIPLKWCTDLLMHQSNESVITNYNGLMNSINDVRVGLDKLSTSLDFNLPLVYIQTIIIAVYAYFLSEVFSDKAYFDPTGEVYKKKLKFSIFVPLFSLIRFILYMGWFKSGLKLIYPLREEQSQFPTSELLDYNIKFASRFVLIDTEVLPPWTNTDEASFTQDLAKDYNEWNDIKDRYKFESDIIV